MEGALEAVTEPEPEAAPKPEASMLPPWLERTFLRGLAAAWGCALEAETLRVVKWENRTVELAATKVRWTSRTGRDTASCDACAITVSFASFFFRVPASVKVAVDGDAEGACGWATLERFSRDGRGAGAPRLEVACGGARVAVGDGPDACAVRCRASPPRPARRTRATLDVACVGSLDGGHHYCEVRDFDCAYRSAETVAERAALDATVRGMAKPEVAATCGDAGVVCSAAGLATAVAVSDRFSRDDGYGVFKAGRLAVRVDGSWGALTEDAPATAARSSTAARASARRHGLRRPPRAAAPLGLLDRLWDADPLPCPSYDATLRVERLDAGGATADMATATARRSSTAGPAELDVVALEAAAGDGSWAFRERGDRPGFAFRASSKAPRAAECRCGAATLRWPDVGAPPGLDVVLSLSRLTLEAPGGLVVDLDDCGVDAATAGQIAAPRRPCPSAAPAAAARGLVLETQTLAGGAVARSRAAADGVDVECDDAAALGAAAAAVAAARRPTRPPERRASALQARANAATLRCGGADVLRGAGLSAEVKAVDGKVDASLVGLFAAATAASASAAVGAPPGGPPPEGPTTLATLSGGEATRTRISPLPWDDDAALAGASRLFDAALGGFARPAAASVRGA
ncbi:hypothetical protein JL721_7434 [Aureococcus anophagefferens]|nr:hypothetical protein JL721_7434 [Aureococcus anophagefferens]